MTVTEHRRAAPARVSCAVLTISDSRTAATDTSGQAIVDILLGAGHVVADRRLVRDDAGAVVDAIKAFTADTAVNVIITTGGTGLTSRDSTYEAVSALFSRTIPGFGELFRMLSFEAIGAAAMLSRATAGVVDGRAVFLLPGSTPAVTLALSRLIVPELGHVVRELAR